MAWIKIGTQQINTHSIIDVFPSKGAVRITRSSSIYQTIEVYDQSVDEIMDLIKEAEQEEIKRAFLAVKQDIVAEVAGEVVQQLKQMMALDKTGVSAPVSLKGMKK
jgi:uncharacterized protein (DUF2236 family)